MAAVTGQMGRSKREIVEDEGVGAPGAGVGGDTLHGYGSIEPPEPEQQHANLTRMVWNRRMIEDSLATTKIALEEQGGKYYFVLDPPLRADVIVWSPAPAKPSKDASDDPDLPAAGKYPRLSLWGKAGKMGCPTWDLPAGAGPVGGTCPGAISAQTVIEPRIRAAQLTPEGDLKASPPGSSAPVHVDVLKAICQSCYAYVGQYSQPNVQAGEIIRYWWCKGAVESGEFQQVLVRSILRHAYPLTPHEVNGGPMKPIRIHSSGDFFSIEYAQAWIDVANELWDIDPTIRMWAPTRTWVHPKFKAFWNDALRSLKGDNLMVRASSYHFNDPAPGPLSPRNAAGSCSIYAHDDARRRGSKDPRYDYSCPIYDDTTQAGEATCAAAKNPEDPTGKSKGCRACWTKPQWRINYQSHF